MRNLLLVRCSIALEWLYQGLWCKLLAKEPRHEAVIGALPFLKRPQAHAALLTLGVAEVFMGVWVVSGVFAPEAAWVQTSLVLLMNGGGVVWARRIIPDPTAMLDQNFVFLMLVWIAAGIL